LVCEALGIGKFLSWRFPCILAEPSSRRGGDVSKTHEWDARCLDTYSAGAEVHCQLTLYCLLISVHGLQFTICCLF
jgi:hypothetical protein